jgi:Acetyltransferase (GNAT) domain
MSLVGRSQQCAVVFEDDRVVVVTTTYDDQPALVRELARTRADGFDLRHTRLGFESYDTHCRHVIAFHRDSGALAGSVRVALGAAGEGLDMPAASKYWSFSDQGRVLVRRGAEISRFWVQPAYRGDFQSLAGLWIGIGELIRRQPDCRFVFGYLGFNGFPVAVAASILGYLVQYHAAPAYSARAIHPLPAALALPLDRAPSSPAARRPAFRVLVSQLSNLEPPHAIPVLLRRYILADATLVGEPAWDPAEERAVVLLRAPAACVVDNVGRLLRHKQYRNGPRLDDERAVLADRRDG